MWSQAESCHKAALFCAYRCIVKVSKHVCLGPVLNVPWVSALKKFVGIKKAFCHYWLLIQVLEKLASLFLSFVIMLSKKWDSKRENGQRKQRIPGKERTGEMSLQATPALSPDSFFMNPFLLLYGDLKSTFKPKFPISWIVDVVIKWIEYFPAKKVLH